MLFCHRAPAAGAAAGGVNRRLAVPNTSPRDRRKQQPACLSGSVFMYVILDIDDVVPIPGTSYNPFVYGGRKKRGSQFQNPTGHIRGSAGPSTSEKRSATCCIMLRITRPGELYNYCPVNGMKSGKKSRGTTQKNGPQQQNLWLRGACGHPLFEKAAQGHGYRV